MPPTRPHALERINVSCRDDGFQLGEAGTETSVFRLLTIPTLRVLVLSQWERTLPFLTPAHLTVLRDCIRALARSGAPPLHTFAIDKDPGEGEEQEGFTDSVTLLMKVESPATSVLVKD